MRPRPILGWCLLVLLPFASGCAKKKLEHFKFYTVVPNPPGTMVPIHVKGQFDGSEFKRARVTGLTHFGNPVAKIRLPQPTPGDPQPPPPPSEDQAPEEPPQFEPLKNPDHHLTWWDLDPKDGLTEPARIVWVVDQFGSKVLVIGPPVSVLLPAHKLGDGREAPKGLNHFKCYSILRHRGSSAQAVLLQDQFDLPNVDRALVGPPEVFCVPVEKLRGNETSPEHENEGPKHLLLYALEPRESYEQVRRSVTDQLQENNPLRDFRSRYLAVPASKPNWRPGHQLPPE